MSFRIRPATVPDAAAIGELISELGYTAMTVDVSERLVALVVDNRCLVLVAAAPDGALLGWINAERRITVHSGSYHEVSGLVVSASARRMGVGRALLEAAEQWARSQGGRAVAVRSNVIREASHLFYEGQGYVRRKSQHYYLKALDA